MLQAITSSETMRIALLVAVFVSVAMIAYVIAATLSRRALVKERLVELQSNSGLVRAKALRDEEMAKGWNRLADIVEKAGVSLVDTKSDALRAKLIQAGYSSPSAPRVFTLIRLLLLFGLPAVFITLMLGGEQPPSIVKLYFVGLGTAALGMYLPNLFISAKADRRREAIVNGFPDCLDLMLVCVEAGLGLEAAFDRVGREMQHSHPLIAQILLVVTLELRAGASREEALRGMATRVQVDEIRAFATLLIQSDKLGSSIGATLRVYANEMREKRRLRAEEKAHRLPVLLAIPLVTCMLPVMIGVLMLPAAIKVVREVAPAMTGG